LQALPASSFSQVRKTTLVPGVETEPSAMPIPINVFAPGSSCAEKWPLSKKNGRYRRKINRAVDMKKEQEARGRRG
jgi:hypothetical protein